jgi:uncharacterized protein (TIGR00255 family)
VTLTSMTGFARAEDATSAVRWHWEIRSVNSRGLDLRTRLPAGFERLEPAVRQTLQNRLSRGACTVSLTLRRDTAVTNVRVNPAALAAVLEAAETLRDNAGVAPPTADGLLALRGVIEVEDPEGEGVVDEELDAAIFATLETALDRLVEMRRSEGERLAPVIRDQVQRIAGLIEEADALPSRAPEQVRARLAEQLSRLLDGASALDPERLHQEAALLATRSDIREELDRLRAHIGAALDLIASGEAVGRRLDFLTQELNREANTICSKSGDIALTRIGLEMKSVVDQLREQVQNVE